MPSPPQRPDTDDGDRPQRPRRVWLVPVAIAVLVAAGFLAANAASSDGGASTGAPSPAPPTPDVLAPSAPDRLRARTTPFRAILSWVDAGEGPVDRWIVSRDGVTIATVTGTDHAYRDTDVQPRKTYVYEVEAVGEGGEAASRTRARTPPAPLSLARFGGVYDVRLRIESSYGITGLESSTDAWRATPACDAGPCDVRVKGVHGDIPPMEADRRRSSYEADGSGRVGFTCGDVPQTSSYDLILRVEAADTVAGSWRATKIGGTLRVSMPEQLGCRSGGVTYAITGRLVEGA